MISEDFTSLIHLSLISDNQFMKKVNTHFAIYESEKKNRKKNEKHHNAYNEDEMDLNIV